LSFDSGYNKLEYLEFKRDKISGIRVILEIRDSDKKMSSDVQSFDIST